MTLTMRSLARKVRRFLVFDDGPTAVEYAVMLALVLLACITAIGLVGSKTSTMFTNESSKLNLN